MFSLTSGGPGLEQQHAGRPDPHAPRRAASTKRTICHPRSRSYTISLPCRVAHPAADEAPAPRRSRQPGGCHELIGHARRRTARRGGLRALDGLLAGERRSAERGGRQRRRRDEHGRDGREVAAAPAREAGERVGGVASEAGQSHWRWDSPLVLRAPHASATSRAPNRRARYGDCGLALASSPNSFPATRGVDQDATPTATRRPASVVMALLRSMRATLARSSRPRRETRGASTHSRRRVTLALALTWTTSQARPTRSMQEISHADGSSCHQRSPCRAEVGKAWWLLCQASPKVGGASQARLRDSSPVAKRRRPKKWQRELMQKVAWWRTNIRTAPPHSSPVRPPTIVPVSATPSPKGMARPSEHPQHEGAVDEAHDRVGEQVLRVALLLGELVAEEDPADVRVEEAAQRPAPAAAVADVGAVRIARLVGEGVVPAVVGDPLDHRALQRHRAQRGQQPRIAALVLKLRWVNRR